MLVREENEGRNGLSESQFIADLDRAQNRVRAKQDEQLSFKSPKATMDLGSADLGSTATTDEAKLNLGGKLSIKDLEKLARFASSIYEEIALEISTDVSISRLEAKFKFTWAPQFFDETTKHDPLYSRSISREVESSMQKLIRSIDQSCTALRGLCPSEQMKTASESVEHASNLLWNATTSVMTRVGATSSDLLAATTQAYERIVKSSVGRATKSLNEQSRGVRALQRLCAAVAERRDPIESLATEMTNVFGLTQSPPVALLDEFKRLKTPFFELVAHLAPDGNGPSVSRQARELGILRWVAAYANTIDSACVLTLNTLRSLANSPTSWRGWDGLCVCSSTSERCSTAFAQNGIGAVVQCPTATHTTAISELAIVATHPRERVALRAVRIARVVLELVKSGKLVPRTVKAELLLPLVSLVGCNATVSGIGNADGEGLAIWTNSEEDSTGMGGPSDQVSNESTPSGCCSMVSRIQTTHVEASQFLLTLGEIHVPRSLLRDFAILATAHSVLSCYSRGCVARIGCSEVAAELSRYSALPRASEELVLMLNSTSRASLLQSIAFVLRKLAKLAEQTNCLVTYGPLPKHSLSSSGVTILASGRDDFLKFTLKTLASMKLPHGASFADTWHISRAAKSRASREPTKVGAEAEAEAEANA